MKSFKKLLSWKSVLLFVASLCIFFVGYLALDWKNIQIDRYNFEQLEKAKPILESIPANAPKFYSLKQFNDIYKVDIKPIENCYEVTSYNGKESFIFGFQLESLLYKFMYGNRYYAYPGYYIPYKHVCIGGLGGGCFDGDRKYFERIVSNPCKE